MVSGGVRSIVQLAILRELENIIDLDIPISNFFDLIIGTRFSSPPLINAVNADQDVVVVE